MDEQKERAEEARIKASLQELIEELNKDSREVNWDIAEKALCEIFAGVIRNREKKISQQIKDGVSRAKLLAGNVLQILDDGIEKLSDKGREALGFVFNDPKHNAELQRELQCKVLGNSLLPEIRRRLHRENVPDEMADKIILIMFEAIMSVETEK